MEWVAAISGLINVYLLTKETIWSWPFGVFNVVLYGFIFYHSKLYSDVILQTFFTILNIYGWYKWTTKTTENHVLKITRMNGRQIWMTMLIIPIVFSAWGYFIGNTTDAAYPYADSFILISSLIAQYLIAIKKIENWILWILVDLVAITVYFLKNLYVTSALYGVYMMLCVMGFVEWKKKLISIQ